ncbi:pyridoxamine 5'-phosphate oxidase-related FMN- binding protein [Kribbella flavida DSM 17836]|uniref:Pyridoxamine 5'-phosphate oxidase-related FMN-binding protein n=1 Tax=Kribbella flavida (strain DSM 17836 / JCM 10339 / NBRC 14399) TaxID=479435 RepID=D2Q3B5_KRIFD|nr:pyridoxamine 5'-phosphate oxidase family protein [Kribbella flavida]ADB34038.1 pyridoxamine 5'-phosphate oxidase-related FMN- binding protein [Kribbella flavida DSM 17836]
MTDHAALARQLIDDNLYLALGTADADGKPWVSPVYFVPQDYRHFYWVSSPDTRHSGNIAARPEVSLAIFDSRVAVGKAQALYVEATAARISDDELEQAMAIYNSRLDPERHFTLPELQGEGLFRLYRATAVEHSVLIRGGDPEYGTGADSRRVVALD